MDGRSGGEWYDVITFVVWELPAFALEEKVPDRNVWDVNGRVIGLDWHFGWMWGSELQEINSTHS